MELGYSSAVAIKADLLCFLAQSLLQAALASRESMTSFFDTTGGTEIRTTDRYKLYHTLGEIAIDSLLDNTDNMLKIPLVNDCFQVLHSDINIIVALSNEQEMTIVNTHRSIVPHRFSDFVLNPIF